VFEEVRGIRDGGGNGSIIGRNTFQRPRLQTQLVLASVTAGSIQGF
jgi:class I fructose-bisphosphate aldolase